MNSSAKSSWGPFSHFLFQLVAQSSRTRPIKILDQRHDMQYLVLVRALIGLREPLLAWSMRLADMGDGENPAGSWLGQAVLCDDPASLLSSLSHLLRPLLFGVRH